MIRFIADTPDGGEMLGIGLSDENLEKLREGRPIAFTLRNPATDTRIVIFWARDDVALAELVAAQEGAVDEETIVDFGTNVSQSETPKSPFEAAVESEPDPDTDSEE